MCNKISNKEIIINTSHLFFYLYSQLFINYQNFIYLSNNIPTTATVSDRRHILSFYTPFVIHLYTTVKKPYSYQKDYFLQYSEYQPITFLARLWHYS